MNVFNLYLSIVLVIGVCGLIYGNWRQRKFDREVRELHGVWTDVANAQTIMQTSTRFAITPQPAIYCEWHPGQMEWRS